MHRSSVLALYLLERVRMDLFGVIQLIDIVVTRSRTLDQDFSLVRLILRNDRVVAKTHIARDCILGKKIIIKDWRASLEPGPWFEATEGRQVRGSRKQGIRCHLSFSLLYVPL